MNLLDASLKKNLRKTFLAKRKLLSDDELVEKNQAIFQEFCSNFAFISYQNIHVFLPIKSQKEINTWLIINYLKQNFSSKNIIIPRVNNDGTMSNFILNETTKLQENKWKILEPIADNNLKKIENKTIDLVILPLLIFDKKGNRVGYGKGFYDKFLATCRADVIKVGLSFFEPIEAIEDVNEFDIKLDFCITPTAIWQFNS